jgi:hypothetical protein
MRSVGLLVALVGVAGIVIGVLSMFGVHLLTPVGSLGDVRLPGAGPVIAGVIMLAAGLAIATSRQRV